ncbi:MAG: MATE family efflux transporter [Lachnospiraceae bacterium]|nr:MATE family efflux transporter [Lachnospiraceae bacterium]
MAKQVTDMTQGNPVSLIIKFAIPMMIGNIFQQFYNIVDSIIVGKLVGTEALAAIGVTGSVTFLFFALCNGIGSGGGIITSQFFGSGDDRQVKKCIANVAYIMVIFPIAVGIIAYIFSEPLLRFLDTPPEVMKDAVTYMHVMCVGLAFVSIYNYVASMLRALGDSRTPLYFLVFSCILNTGLDFVFVYFCKWGVFGAAIATLISQFVSGVVCLLYAFKFNSYFKLKKDDLRPNGGIIWNAVKIGVPLSLQFSLIAISCMALQRVVNHFGPVAIAAFTATSRIEQVIHQPYQTLGTALSTYTGQNFGAKKYERIRLGYRKSMIMMAIFTAAMVPVMQIFGKPITSIFVDDPAVIDMGAVALRITSIFYVFLGVIYVVRGVLNGVGDAFFALLNGIIEVIGRLVVPIALTMVAFIGLWGIWWSVGIVWFLSGFTAWLRYVWYNKKHLTEKKVQID